MDRQNSTRHNILENLILQQNLREVQNLASHVCYLTTNHFKTMSSCSSLNGRVLRFIYPKPLRRKNVLFLHNAIHHLFTKAQDRIMFRSLIKCHNVFTNKVSYNILYLAALVKGKKHGM